MGGTTFEMATPWICRGSIARERSSVSMNMPYSSAVCSRRVVRRHDTRSRSPSNTPTFVFVLPTSSTSNMSEDSDLAGHDAMTALAVLEQQRAIDVEIHRDAGDTVDGDTPSDRVGYGQPARADRRQPVVLELRAPVVEGLERHRQHGVALDVASRLQPDGRGAGGEAGRERALPEVDANADGNDAGGAAGARGVRGGRHTALEQNAGDLTSADEDIVRPFEASTEPRHARQRFGHGQCAHERVAAPVLRRAPRSYEH